VLVVTQQADWAALLGSSISPDVTGLSSSVRRAVNPFRKGTSGIEGTVLLLLALVLASFHSSEFLRPFPSVCSSRGVCGCLAVDCGCTADCAWN